MVKVGGSNKALAVGGVNNFLLPLPRGRCRITPSRAYPHTHILRHLTAEAMSKWPHSLTVPHGYSCFSFTAEYVIICTPSTNSHA